ncbi:HNH endonuclease [Planosporangium thailandense]|uniref:HNH endonuclease n=2 Tax=Planosporangium thailandense TaxID=765197 RepID=A0ABX0Y6A2_9ACTN|nr:HNH endonuclease family protein [Planosporangium thailandense]NJC72829.1 HNH endonuclease [Planosporangium thailandense]
MRTPRRLAAAFVLTAALSATGCVPNGSAPGGAVSDSPTSAASGDASQARADLDALTVAAPRSMAGYSRDRFPHWTQQGNGCDTREYVLKRDGTSVTTSTSCHATGGKWLSPYDHKTVTDAAKLDIDHVVPLANAWRSGANAWTDDKRSQFANDLTRPQLVAVSLTTNRAKGDQDPSQWKPPYQGYWCQYAENWITVKRYWQLTVTTAEKQALVDMLGTCQ